MYTASLHALARLTNPQEPKHQQTKREAGIV